MNRLLVLIIPVTLILSACSKKGQVDPAGVVTINGTHYPTVTIGTQTWTSVNYNGPGGVNYDNSSTNDPVYGKLYSYTEAEAISLPAGWHLPTQADFTTLFNTLGAVPNSQNYYVLADTTGRKLMATTTWTVAEIGTNQTGFNAVGAGFQASGVFSNLGQIDNILTTSKFSDGENISLEIYDYDNASLTDLNAVLPKDTDRGSVRFVKDN